MNALILRISAISLVWVCLIFTGCQHLNNIEGITCAMPVREDLTVETYFYKENGNFRLKVTVKTFDDVINEDFELYNGLNIFFKDYKNAILAVEDLNMDSATIKDAVGDKYILTIGASKEEHFINTEMLVLDKCRTR